MIIKWNTAISRRLSNYHKPLMVIFTLIKKKRKRHMPPLPKHLPFFKNRRRKVPYPGSCSQKKRDFTIDQIDNCQQNPFRPLQPRKHPSQYSRQSLDGVRCRTPPFWATGVVPRERDPERGIPCTLRNLRERCRLVFFPRWKR